MIIIIIIIITILYLIIGAIAPFVIQKKITAQATSDFNPQAVKNMEGSSERVMLLETSQSAWEERLRLLNQAKKSIILTTFEMRCGESTQDIASILLHKAKEGIQVYILVDGFSGSFRMKRRNFFYTLSSDPNITIKLYSPIHLFTPWTSQGRMHDKYLIVDNLGYILGGRNTFDCFIGSYKFKNKSLDREVLVYNPKDENSSIKEIMKYFDSIWDLDVCKLFGNKENYQKRKRIHDQAVELESRYLLLKSKYTDLFKAHNYEENTHTVEGIKFLSGSTSIYGKEPEVFYKIKEIMKLAEDSVVIHSPYAVCNRYMYDSLKEVKEAVPNTRILLNYFENGGNFLASSDYLRNKNDLIKTGIDIYEYDGGTSYHGKSIVVDHNITMIGSYNLDLRSTYVDTELMLIIKSEGLNKELRSFIEILELDSRIVSEEMYDIPPNHINNPLSSIKHIIFRILGIVVRPFRNLL